MSDSPLPPLYDRWMRDMTGSDIAGEPEATCLDCAMLDPSPGVTGFHPATKCCTYTPAVPNFLVGAALADPRLDEVDGRATLDARIDSRVGVDPIGLHPGPVTAVLAARAGGAFGFVPELRCPHYHPATGKCGVWLHRNAICSTWFCKHDRGAVGQRFFYALRDLLEEVERDLARYCVLELGAPYRVPDRDAPAATLTAADLAGTAADGAYRALWGSWVGRERELYAAAHELVAGLEWRDVLAIGGPELGLRARIVDQARHQRDHAVVPQALVLRKLDIRRHGDPYVLGTYAPTDPIAVPAILFDQLYRFRGQPTDEALAEIAREADLELDDELLVRLVDVGLLADAGRDADEER